LLSIKGIKFYDVLKIDEEKEKKCHDIVEKGKENVSLLGHVEAIQSH
jgi:hypothetical protein